MSTSSTPRPERRRHPRYELDVAVKLLLASAPGTTFEGRMKDISAGGCLFRATLPSDDFANVSLSFKRSLRAPLVAGKVVRRVGSEAFAVSFGDGGPELGRLISALAAITPAMRSDFVSGFLDASVEVY